MELPSEISDFENDIKTLISSRKYNRYQNISLNYGTCVISNEIFITGHLHGTSSSGAVEYHTFRYNEHLKMWIMYDTSIAPNGIDEANAVMLLDFTGYILNIY